MKQEHYIKVVNDVVHRMERHADIVMNVKQVAEYLGLSVGAGRPQTLPTQTVTLSSQCQASLFQQT